MSARTTRWIVAAASSALILGAMLSRAIEPGVRVEKVSTGGVSRFGAAIEDNERTHFSLDIFMSALMF
jgi:hypothetical protein